MRTICFTEGISQVHLVHPRPSRGSRCERCAGLGSRWMRTWSQQNHRSTSKTRFKKGGYISSQLPKRYSSTSSSEPRGLLATTTSCNADCFTSQSNSVLGDEQLVREVTRYKLQLAMPDTWRKMLSGQIEDEVQNADFLFPHHVQISPRERRSKRTIRPHRELQHTYRPTRPSSRAR